MYLLDDVDLAATEKNVDYFLGKRLSHSLWSCGRNLVPAHTEQEKRLVDSLSTEKILNAVYKTIIHCSENSAIILIGKYIKHKSQDRLIVQLQCERTQFYKALKPRALLEFADRFNFWQKECKVNPDDKIDLHIYK